MREMRRPPRLDTRQSPAALYILPSAWQRYAWGGAPAWQRCNQCNDPVPPPNPPLLTVSRPGLAVLVGYNCCCCLLTAFFLHKVVKGSVRRSVVVVPESEVVARSSVPSLRCRHLVQTKRHLVQTRGTTPQAQGYPGAYGQRIGTPLAPLISWACRRRSSNYHQQHVQVLCTLRSSNYH